MKLLAFAASNSRKSINKMLVEFAIGEIQREIIPDAQVTLLDLNDFEMPIYSIDRETESGIPQLAQKFYDHIGSADAIIVSFAEHNGLVTAAWKNIFDWMSRIDSKVWQGKPMIILAATPGGRAGASVLNTMASLIPFFDGDLRGQYGVGKWYEAWSPESMSLSDAEQTKALVSELAKLHTA